MSPDDGRAGGVGGLVVAGVAAMPALGGLVMGLSVPYGGFCALALLCAGISIAGVLWWATRAYRGGAVRMARLSFAGSGGLAFYGSMSWLFWRVGLPIDLGVVRDGRMSEFWWLGPATAAYCAVCYAQMRWGRWRRPA